MNENTNEVVETPELKILKFGKIKDILTDEQLLGLSPPLEYLLGVDISDCISAMADKGYKMEEDGKTYGNLEMPFMTPDQIFQLLHCVKLGFINPVITILPDCDPADPQIAELIEITQAGIDHLASHPIPEDKDPDAEPTSAIIEV